jgi:DNA polymerase III subunit gamma/tau
VNEACPGENRDRNPGFAEGHESPGHRFPGSAAERCPRWLKERDWKSRVPPKSGTGGSNPPLSARFIFPVALLFPFIHAIRASHGVLGAKRKGTGLSWLTMVYEVLARKWRPQVFQDVVGQEHITRTLINAIRSDRLSHAYLFSGARGVGKTSVARILAKAINCTNGEPGTPCNTCHSCLEVTGGSSLDVQEIDGASNRGIEEIRELRENIKYMPSSGRYRVYIVDEVHMLTLHAFNALLKTLEEPPAHVKFIFATTDPHKVPVTILSRCQRFDFKRIPLSLMIEHLEKIAAQEGLEISKAGMALIGRKSEGSMRDAESLLDQVVSYSGKKVEDRDIADMLGILDSEIIRETAVAVLEKAPKTCLEIVDRIHNVGYDIREFYRGLMDQFRDLLVSLIDPENESLKMSESNRQETRRIAERAGSEKLQQCLNLLIAREEHLRFASHPRLILESVLIKLCRLGEVLTLDELLRKLETLERRLMAEPEPPSAENPAAERLSDPPGEWKEAHTVTPLESAPAEKESWEGFIQFLSTKNPPMANVLRNWRFQRMAEGNLEIAKGDSSFASTFLDDPDRLKRLMDYGREFYGREIQIRVIPETGTPQVQAPSAEKRNALPEKKKNDLPAGPVQDVLEIFKGEVVGGTPRKKDENGTGSPRAIQRREK